jgi:hypothetical protein
MIYQNPRKEQAFTYQQLSPEMLTYTLEQNVTAGTADGRMGVSTWQPALPLLN